MALPRLRFTTSPQQKVDRLEWAAGFAFKSYGVRIGIRSNNAAFLEELYDRLPHNWKIVSAAPVDRLYSILIAGSSPRPNLRRFNLLYGDHVRLARSRSTAAVLDRLESDLRLFVAELARGRVFVHAGVVAWRGRAVVIPGRSFSGKSTLVAELVKAGATYYSDEYAVFDARGRVHPFPKPLEIRKQGDTKQAKIDVSQLGGATGTKPIPVGLVAITRFKQGANWRPRRLTPGKGVLELLANTVSARRNPEQALTMLHHVANTAPVLKGVRGEAVDIVETMLKRMEQPGIR